MEVDREGGHTPAKEVVLKFRVKLEVDPFITSDVQANKGLGEDSMEPVNGELVNAAVKAGATWAMQEAEWSEIRAIQDHFSNPENFFNKMNCSKLSPAEQLCLILHPEWEGDRKAAFTFWLDAAEGCADYMLNPDYWNHFVDAVILIGEKVNEGEDEDEGMSSSAADYN